MTDERRHGERRKAPSMQWYPGDWQRDTGIQSCSLGARGLWLEMLNLMFDGSPKGYLRAGGRSLDASRLAPMVAATFDEVVLLLKELDAAHVFSRTDDGTIYSRRMVRDEALRISRAEGGKKSLGNPNVPRPKVSTKDILKDGTAVPSPAVAVAVAVEPKTPKPKAPTATGDDWVPQFASAWKARFGGKVPWPRIGAALKDLRADYPDTEILARWQRYLAEEDEKFISPEGFAQKFSRWTVKRKGLRDSYLLPEELV